MKIMNFLQSYWRILSTNYLLQVQKNEGRRTDAKTLRVRQTDDTRWWISLLKGSFNTDDSDKPQVHAFFISNAFFRPRLKCCLAKSKIP